MDRSRDFDTVEEALAHARNRGYLVCSDLQDNSHFARRAYDDLDGYVLYRNEEGLLYWEIC